MSVQRRRHETGPTEKEGLTAREQRVGHLEATVSRGEVREPGGPIQAISRPGRESPLLTACAGPGHTQPMIQAGARELSPGGYRYEPMRRTSSLSSSTSL